MQNTLPWSAIQAAFIQARRAVSTPMAMSANMKATAWCRAMGTPNVLRSKAYFVASVRARWAKPVAPAATCMATHRMFCQSGPKLSKPYLIALFDYSPSLFSALYITYILIGVCYVCKAGYIKTCRTNSYNCYNIKKEYQSKSKIKSIKTVQ